jgi:hypothetical protein
MCFGRRRRVAVLYMLKHPSMTVSTTIAMQISQVESVEIRAYYFIKFNWKNCQPIVRVSFISSQKALGIYVDRLAFICAL